MHGGPGTVATSARPGGEVGPAHQGGVGALQNAGLPPPFHRANRGEGVRRGLAAAILFFLAGGWFTAAQRQRSIPLAVAGNIAGSLAVVCIVAVLRREGG